MRLGPVDIWSDVDLEWKVSFEMILKVKLDLMLQQKGYADPVPTLTLPKCLRQALKAAPIPQQILTVMVPLMSREDGWNQAQLYPRNQAQSVMIK